LVLVFFPKTSRGGEGGAAMKILILCLVYGLVFGVILALERMARADVDQWRLRPR
jgi:hypothetical protein